jgi:hypothetical protein
LKNSPSLVPFLPADSHMLHTTPSPSCTVGLGFRVP